MAKQYPNEQFQQRRRSHVENENQPGIDYLTGLKFSGLCVASAATARHGDEAT